MNKRLGYATIAATFAIALMSLVQPLYALQIVQDIRLQRLELSTASSFAFPLCDKTDTFTLDISLLNYHFVQYSDGTYRVTAVTVVKYTDSSGNLVASSPQTQLFGDATTHNQFNVVEVCHNSQVTFLNFHYGYTITNGIISEIHLVSVS